MTRQTSFSRLIRLVLVAGIVSTALFAQQTQNTTATRAGSTSSPSAVDTHPGPHRSTRARKASHRKRRSYSGKGKRAVYRPEFTDHSVQVINGLTTQNIVFHDEQKTSEPRNGQPARMKVEVVNGTQTETQYFLRSDNQPVTQAGQSRRPVVVGVQSSDTRFVGGNKNPVVTSITSSGSADANAADSGGQKVATQIAPRPKRRAYQSDGH